jgi:cell division protein FtsL
MQIVLLILITLLMCASMVWIAIRVGRQWAAPKKQYQKKLDDIQRRKRELGLTEDDESIE